jgi:hypothetical protein
MALTPELSKKTHLKEVAGIPLQVATVDNWRQIQSFEAKPDDLLICTYPKSGDCGQGNSTDLPLLSQAGILSQMENQLLVSQDSWCSDARYPWLFGGPAQWYWRPHLLSSATHCSWAEPIFPSVALLHAELQTPPSVLT